MFDSLGLYKLSKSCERIEKVGHDLHFYYLVESKKIKSLNIEKKEAQILLKG